MGTGKFNAGEKWGRAGWGEGVFCNGLASHPVRSRNTPSHFLLQKTGINSGCMGLWLDVYFTGNKPH